MENIQPFLIDGKAYNVWVSKLTRKFSVLDSGKTGRTQDGTMYRDVIGTFYNYSMTVEQCRDDHESMDALWEAISMPEKSHICTFLYNQETLTQEMYITSGEQGLESKTERGTHWGEMTLSFVATKPKVVP